MDVLYQDNHIIAVNKKSSEIIQGDKTGDKPLSEKLKDYIKVKFNKPGNVFVGIIHRIDRPVSGVVLFARTSKGLSRFNDLFRSKDIEKTYWAVVKNKPPKEEDRLIHHLVKNQNKNITKAHDNPVNGSKEAILRYRVLEKLDNYYLLEIKLETGRSHQIRTQLSKIGCPIKGDIKYGFKRTNDDKSIHLHARKIEFMHPIKKEHVTIIAPPPKDVIWDDVIKKCGDY